MIVQIGREKYHRKLGKNVWKWVEPHWDNSSQPELNNREGCVHDHCTINDFFKAWLHRFISILIRHNSSTLTHFTSYHFNECDCLAFSWCYGLQGKMGKYSGYFHPLSFKNQREEIHTINWCRSFLPSAAEIFLFCRRKSETSIKHYFIIIQHESPFTSSKKSFPIKDYFLSIILIVVWVCF